MDNIKNQYLVGDEVFVIRDYEIIKGRITGVSYNCLYGGLTYTIENVPVLAPHDLIYLDPHYAYIALVDMIKEGLKEMREEHRLNGLGEAIL